MLLSFLLVWCVLLVGCNNASNTTLHTSTISQIEGTQTDTTNNNLQSELANTSAVLDQSDISEPESEPESKPEIDSQSESKKPTESSVVSTPKKPISEPSDPIEEEEPEEEMYIIGIVQFNNGHSSLQSVEGFRTGAGEGLESNSTFIIKNCNGDVEKCKIIIDEFVKDGVDLIMTDGPYATQYAAKITKTIPIVGVSVTDFDLLIHNQKNITGITNAVSQKELVGMIAQCLPDVKSVGLIEMKNDPDTEQNKSLLLAEMTNRNLSLSTYEVSKETLTQTLKTACDENQAIIILDDPVLASNTNAIHKICSQKKIPVITTDTTVLDECGNFGLCNDSYECGLEAGWLAYQILGCKKAPNDFEFKKPFSQRKLYHEERCTNYNIAVPSEYESFQP